jgi:hypothetical protein
MKKVASILTQNFCPFILLWEQVALVLSDQASPDDLFIGAEPTHVHTAATISSKEFQEPR